MMVATKGHEFPHLFGTPRGLEYIAQPQILELFKKSVFGMFNIKGYSIKKPTPSKASSFH